MDTQVAWVLPVIGTLALAILILVGAVWFGMTIVAPRIGRALDRADADEEEPGDRPD